MGGRGRNNKLDVRKIGVKNEEKGTTDWGFSGQNAVSGSWVLLLTIY
jgi:hypothetical protein